MTTALRKAHFIVLPQAEHIVSVNYNEELTDQTVMEKDDNASVPTLYIETRHNVLVSVLELTFYHKDYGECYTISLRELPIIGKDTLTGESLVPQEMIDHLIRQLGIEAW